METLRNVVGAIIGAGFVANGVAVGLLQIIPLREPSLVGLILSAPRVLTHPTFLWLWAVLSAIGVAIVVISRIRETTQK